MININRLCVILLALPSFALCNEQISSSDFVSVELAVKVIEDGQLRDDEVNHIKLNCYKEECWMDTLVLNRCSKLKNNNSQRPFTYTYKSTDKNTTFKVKQNFVHVVVKGTDYGGESVSQYAFEFSRENNGSTTLTSFTGGFVKKSRIIKNAIVVTYLPVHGNNDGDSYKVKLACPIELPTMKWSK